MGFNPDNTLDLVAYLIVGLPAIITALTAFAVQRKELRGQRALVEKTLYEVKNDHRSNLRDDIDELADAIHEVKDEVRGVGRDVTGLREELRIERAERIEGDRRRGQ